MEASEPNNQLPSGSFTTRVPHAVVEPNPRFPRINRLFSHAGIRPSVGWVQAFIIFQFVCQLGLLVPGIGPGRVLLRGASFGASLMLLVMFGCARRLHPAAWAALGALGIIGLNIIHPLTNNLLAAMAELLMNAAILAPLFWASRVKIDVRGFRRIVLTLWAIQTISALVGVAQVYFPGRFDPPVSASIQARGDWYLRDLKITLSNGAQVFRPMGLTDIPGGAASAGLYAMLFGLGLLLLGRPSAKSWILKPLWLASMAIGLFCMYLCQIRSVLVMAGICVLLLGMILCLRREWSRAVLWAIVVLSVIGSSFLWAFSVGGNTVTSRLATLVDGSTRDVYYKNRGYFLEQTIVEYLPEYPFGAGLGRWGMMHDYFGNDSNPDSTYLWAEIQWTAWLFDGGLPLILAYVAAIAAATWIAFKIAFSRRKSKHGRFSSQSELCVWGALILAYNVAAFAVTFNYPLFNSEHGLEFWVLNACLYGVYLRSIGHPTPGRSKEKNAILPGRARPTLVAE
jgi:hypothetical protein